MYHTSSISQENTKHYDKMQQNMVDTQTSEPGVLYRVLNVSVLVIPIIHDSSDYPLCISKTNTDGR